MYTIQHLEFTFTLQAYLFYFYSLNFKIEEGEKELGLYKGEKNPSILTNHRTVQNVCLKTELKHFGYHSILLIFFPTSTEPHQKIFLSLQEKLAIK